MLILKILQQTNLYNKLLLEFGHLHVFATFGKCFVGRPLCDL